MMKPGGQCQWVRLAKPRRTICGALKAEGNNIERVEGGTGDGVLIKVKFGLCFYFYFYIKQRFGAKVNN